MLLSSSFTGNERNRVWYVLPLYVLDFFVVFIVVCTIRVESFRKGVRDKIFIAEYVLYCPEAPTIPCIGM